MRAKAMSAAGGTGGSAFADWAEDLCRADGRLHPEDEGESAKAIATATEARGKGRQEGLSCAEGL